MHPPLIFTVDPSMNLFSSIYHEYKRKSTTFLYPETPNYSFPAISIFKSTDSSKFSPL